MKEKKIKLNKPYITLGQFLKSQDYISSGGEAKFFLADNLVFVNKIKENRRGRKLYSGDTLVIADFTFIFYED